ncbi:hypothetical protein CSC89_07355 [Klebsiella pneumoniae]|nr:hypothetical protein CSC89_07355 [Klebsiella pneumoniae]HBY0409041.1 hypothetical protein [Klebsiella pneumoniae subsp. pneumoniae]PXI64587.1 hypothetical protein DMP51_00075 [Klebsiella pneumoniae]HBX2130680.1 hypothetical protein [Klebsiella pneumoniae]HBX5845832.1 hypothetical protein [Klebsiella pneumoniae]
MFLKMTLWSFISLSLILFSIKILAYVKATPSEKMWNENNTCYAITYIPNYKPFGGVGRFQINHFSSSMIRLEKK